MEPANSATGGPWTLYAIEKKTAPKIQAPPGLTVENRWEVFEEKESDESDKKEQRTKDLKEMERTEKGYAEDFPGGQLINDSKRAKKKVRFEGVKTKNMVPLSLFLPGKDEDASEGKKGLFPVTSGDPDGWQWIKGVVDSGAAESVAHPSMCPQYPVRPSAGSKAGQSYTSASGDSIPNLGEQVLPIMTGDGRPGHIKYQSADVSRALNSVSEICDAGGDNGQLVLFSKWGGQILNLETGHRTPFEREENIYTLGMWVCPSTEGASVFPRPGR